MKKILLFCLLVGLTTFSAPAQYFQWAKKIHKNTQGEIPLAGGNNLIATTGMFGPSITLGSLSFTSVGHINSYLAVHDQAGNFLWAKQIITVHNVVPQVAVDQQNNILITGAFIDSLKIDGTVLRGATLPAFGIYVAKFSPTGTLLWAHSSNILPGQFPYNNYLNATSIAADGNGNVFLTGDFTNTISFNGTNLTANVSRDAFIVKYNASGVFQWANSTTNLTQTHEHGEKITALPNGNIYLTTFNQNIQNPNNSTFSITSFDTNGVKLWDKSIAYIAGRSPGITFDNLNNTYLTGPYFNTITIGSTTLNTNQFSWFLAKLDGSGNWKWAKTIISRNPSGLDSLYFPESPHIVFSPTNELGIAGSFYGTAYLNGVTINSSNNNNPNSFVAKFDTAGTLAWVNNATGTANYIHGISSDPNGNFFINGVFFYGNVQFSATTLNLNYSTSGTEAFLAKVTNEANSISGTVFIDSNHNGVKDSNENPFSQLVLENTPGPIYGISNLDGTYNMYLPTGANTLSIPSPPPYYSLIPASHSVTFTGTNQTQTGKDFALQPIPNSNDVKVTVTNITPARPGFQSKYRLTFHNSGTTVLADTLKFSHDTGTLTFVSSLVAPLSNSNGKMAWYYQNLQPNETRNIDVTFLVPTTTVLGTPLQAIASIKPFTIDLFQADNIDTLNHVVMGAYDPNDKQVDKTTLSPSVAANGEYLYYSIRFQNTGTDTAFTVVVTDRIMSQLNLSDFEMVSASHNYKLNVIDGNMLEWRFDNILLPDSNRNEPASHGFIRFRLKSKAGLVLGDSITNQAAIYFDYNAPVITNHAVTKVTNPTGIKERTTNIQAFKLYPNPAKNYVMVKAEFRKNTTATVSLVNLLGQTLSKVTLPANNQIHYQMPLHELSKGVYLIRLQTETGMQTQRLVIQ